ncbi:MAG: hypothetical protein DMG47_08710 [Acidobacteria bacterium]|nr:MAG: hypothetical protein DMG47_08710 [Acidobacteriota bacterium]
MFPRIVKKSRAFADCGTNGVCLQWDGWSRPVGTSRSKIAESFGWNFGGTHPGWFWAKSAEAAENKGVDFFHDAK